jgi:hypothetical protein
MINRDIIERIEKLEYFFSGKIKNPIYEAITLHVENFEERIKKIESSQLLQKLDPQVWKLLTKRIDKIEEMTLNGLSIEAYVKLNDKVLELEKYVKNMTEVYIKKFVKNAVPHKCPVCTGFGSTRISENTAAAPSKHFIKTEPCNFCDGKGIVWS